MTALEIYRAQYEEERSRWDNEWSKYKWVARKVFDLTTYDDYLDERFANDILEVCKVILEERNFEYMRKENNYIKFVLVCQLLVDRCWLDWGTSIRGAWFEADSQNSKDILEECEWCEWDTTEKRLERHKIDKVPFTVENLKALIDFVEE